MVTCHAGTSGKWSVHLLPANALEESTDHFPETHRRFVIFPGEMDGLATVEQVNTLTY